jgi:hypothetical protein
VKKQFTSAFSLVELTLAVGIASFCLITLFGLVPVAVLTNRNATSQTAATNILSSAVGDLRAAPVPRPTPSPVQSALYRITIGGNSPDASATPIAQIRYFDSEGRCSTDLAGSTRPDGSTWSPPIQTRYQLTITFPTANPTPTPPAPPTTYADLKIIWPPAVTSPAPVPSGSVEILAALDRN